MKGIRKLFFGLILMTLFGVGFKVDAWATITTELAWTDDDGVPLSSFSWEDAKYLTGIMSVDLDDFPGSGESSAVYEFIIFDKEPTDPNYKYGDPLDPDYNKYTVSLNNNYSYTIKKGNRPEGSGTVSGPTSIPIIKIPKETVRTKVGGKIAGYFGSRDYYAIATNTNDPSECYYSSPNTITLVKVTGGAYLGGTTYLYKVYCGESDISNGYYMFTDDTNLGETQVFTSAVPSTNYELQTPNGWSDDYNNSTIATDYFLNKAVVTAKTPTDIAGSTDPGIILKENLAYTGGPASLNTVYVTNGKSISLSNFISSSSKSATPVFAALSAGGILNVASDELSAISDISITGNSSGKTFEDALTITNIDSAKTVSKADVVVYTNKPTLTKTSTSSSGSGASYKFSIKMPYGVYYTDSSKKPVKVDNLSSAVLVFSGKEGTYEKGITLETTSDDKLTKTQDETLTRKELTNIFRDICKEDHETVSVKAYAYVNGSKDANIVSDAVTFDVYKISLDGSAGASYQVDDTDVSGYFYGISGSSYKVVARGNGSIDKSNSSSEFANITASNGTATISSYGVAGVRTLKAAFTTSNSSSMPPSSTRNPSTEGDDYDDVPKTGESKTDIWILWSVLFVSILGAGFMIWKRFGLVRAIAEADEEVAVAEHKEEVKAKKKEKEDKLKMLKDLRNL